MTRLEIEHCNDMEKLKQICLDQHHKLFLIGEALVSESKLHISAEDAVTRIRDYMSR